MTRAALHLLAEDRPSALACCTSARETAHRLLRDISSTDADASLIDNDAPALRAALANVTVTYASLATEHPRSRSEPTVDEGLHVLEQIARDPTLRGTEAAARAANNALNLQLRLLLPTLMQPSSQVDAWMRVSEAQTLVRDNPFPHNISRIAVDLAIDCGQWERAWSHTLEQIERDGERTELIAVSAKASWLAWHRGLPSQAREHGLRARALSVAVDQPWVRVYAYLGGVIAAACGGGQIGPALQAYTRCTTRLGHTSRPYRAWQAASVALQSGHPAEQVRGFLAHTIPDYVLEGIDEAAIELADAKGESVTPVDARRVINSPRPAPVRARACLALSRTYRRQGMLAAAVLELNFARQLLHAWPGWLLTEVENELELLTQPLEATPAQQQVLELLAEGMSNSAIANRLGRSQRTVAVHVAALLKQNGASSRTALVAQYFRALSSGGHFA